MFYFRFSHLIRGQFYGHCHRDDIRIHFDVRDPLRPVGMEYLTPNNGPYKGLNPSFRLYYVDGDHRDTTRVSAHQSPIRLTIPAIKMSINCLIFIIVKED